MPKTSKYYFDEHTLTCKREEISLKELLLRFFTRGMVAVWLGVFFFFIAFFFFDTPKERELKRENEQLKLRYKILNSKINNSRFVLNQLQERDNNMYRPVFEEPPIPKSIREAGFGGVNRYEELKHFKNASLMIETTKNLDILKKQLYIQSKSYDQICRLTREKEKMLSCIPAIQPVASKYITGFCPFGMRMHPILNYVRLHAGVDLVAPKGTPIYAAGDGVVTRARLGKGIGYYVKINHGYGYETLYGHVSEMLVKPGQHVKRGDTIALVGTTGLSYVDHLHYEVHKNGKPLDPFDFYYDDLSDKEYQRMIEITSSQGRFGVE